jgi:hypothetical protein
LADVLSLIDLLADSLLFIEVPSEELRELLNETSVDALCCALVESEPDSEAEAERSAFFDSESAIESLTESELERNSDAELEVLSDASVETLVRLLLDWLSETLAETESE